ncbi:MAG: indole-3-glycerol phosphate synthase TrpC [Planctomycetes bacterium]|nr:indole-3-glycerol phosphate synthase TrpC [Planctomycetota bacterium]
MTGKTTLPEPQNILGRILQTKRKELELLKSSTSVGRLGSAAESAGPARNFFHAVTRQPAGLINLIAEIKRASPSAGVIRGDFDPVAIARQYAAAGADAISVLTDAEYFHGSLDHLSAVRQAVDLPVLRKDFLIDPLQVWQSRAAGADAILLIAAALPPGQLLDMLILASQLRMTCLVEVHDADELLAVRSAIGFPHRAYSLLGINNRDLTTFAVDLGTTLRLAQLAGPDVPIVSESGIKTTQDVRKLAAAGVKAVLVGQTLMSSPDIAASVRQLKGLER